ncbi:SIS domain-containing protein [Candidatus Neomarinimicrobiota bacterium]
MKKTESLAAEYLDDLRVVLPQLDTEKIDQAISWLREARDEGKMVFTCGNGGSASIASQMVVDIVKGGSYGKSSRFRMMSLTDSIATITAYANDIDYASVFVEPMKNFAEPGDLLIAISGSGNSINVLKAVECANDMGMRTVGLTTEQGGTLKDIAQLPLLVPSSHMGHLEDSFFIITHILCYAFI